MRYNNQLTSKSFGDLRKNGEESSELSGDSLESCTEPIINSSVMSSQFTWNLQPRKDFGKAQSFSALCQAPEVCEPIVEPIRKIEDIPSPR